MEWWPFPPSHLRPSWKLMSTVTMCATGIVCKAFLKLTSVQTTNYNRLLTAAVHRPEGTPLITISNHRSCLDDPLMWGLLPLRSLLSEKCQRWVPGAQEVMFTNPLHSWYFSTGKIVPVVRGDGVYQRGMDFLLSKLDLGAWVHVFPEGKINLENAVTRWKWGVGRLIAECTKTPIVIPVWHVGMEDILPTRSPYIPQLFKKLTVLVGEPIDLSFLDAQSSDNAVVKRRQITGALQKRIEKLKDTAEELHRSWTK